MKSGPIREVWWESVALQEGTTVLPFGDDDFIIGGIHHTVLLSFNQYGLAGIT